MEDEFKVVLGIKIKKGKGKPDFKEAKLLHEEYNFKPEEVEVAEEEQPETPPNIIFLKALNTNSLIKVNEDQVIAYDIE